MKEQKATTKSRRTLIALVLGGVTVVVCYFFVDRPVAWFVHNHRFYSDDFLLWPPLVSNWLGYLVVLGILAVAVGRLWRRGGPLQTLLLAIATNLVATAGIKTLLKWAFGRTWPETWTDNNPSLIANGAVRLSSFPFRKSLPVFSVRSRSGYIRRDLDSLA